MTLLSKEIDAIHERETQLSGPYPSKNPNELLRMVFLFPFSHAYSLMCGGPMGLYDLVNRSPGIPAVAERCPPVRQPRP
ncbi:hypothetical protein ACIP69_21680 [Streptomyces hygroscopicus]|uniref:hypothetical protein n=1 Tax=Streptomyces hygroscopicus TaxID=1912 RepID=UPI0038052792